MSENSGSRLPHALEFLWGRSERRTTGRAQALSLERIVAAAISIADGEGLAALSMARLAERLGCATMSLYRHVANKDELQTFMLDAAPGKPPEIELAPCDWRAELARWATELLAVYHRHPWILQVAVGPPLDPGQLAWVDAGLRALGGTALGPRDRFSVILLVMHYVRGEAQISANLLRGNPDAEALDLARRYGELLALLVDARRFPALAEAVGAGVFAEQAGEDAGADFTFGLERILDGVEMLVRERAVASGPS
ncbi:TetR/AcrR family transcriptional regulator [Sphaerisporangium sp. NBC_01403]|uniref:TetR/AcrR family transcriptional regulator n=1 Tax=Sphaerisporangium sp. NBC_01403 TaxID=2903599 RepID=UPI00324813F4